MNFQDWIQPFQIDGVLAGLVSRSQTKAGNPGLIDGISSGSGSTPNHLFADICECLLGFRSKLCDKIRFQHNFPNADKKPQHICEKCRASGLDCELWKALSRSE